MNNIDEMPAKCKSCPYWEACEYPGICQDTEPKPAENGNINAGIAENLQNRPTDGVLISRREALDALMRERMHLLDNDQPGAEHILTHHGFNVIADLPPAQMDFCVTEKIDKAYDDGYNAGYMQGEFDARNEAQTVQPKHGEWVKISPANIYECSKCGKHVMTNDISAYDFCHGCGADMKGGDNGKT